MLTSLRLTGRAGRFAKTWMIAVTVALVATLCTAFGPGHSTAAAAVTSSPFLGTLGTAPTKAAQESRSGVKVAMMEVSWRTWEPSEGVFNPKYEQEMQLRLQSLRAAGMRVTLGLGLHFTPSWVLAKSNSVLMDQYGNRSGQANLIFNQKLRDLADVYLDRVNQVLGFSNFWAIRVTSGGRSELLYPEGGHYWAFDADAQNGPDLPAGVGTNPLPGWTPGTAGPSTAAVSAWATWYIDALADTARWQADVIRNDGFTGYVQVVTPGVGIYARKFSTWVNANMPAGAFGVGAVWATVYSDLADIPNLVAYVSSVGDNSGGNTACDSADDAEAIDGPNTVWWGSTRWITHIAHLNGIKVAGENAGYSRATSSYYTSKSSSGMMATSMRLASACGLQGLYWAHDDQFWNMTVAFSRFTTYTTRTAALPALAG